MSTAVSTDADLDIDLADHRVKKWIPIENNSDLLTQYIHKLGVTPAYTITDIYGTDPDLLAMLQYTELVSIILLFPYSDNFKRKRQQQRTAQPATNTDLYFLPQIVSNACGTVALTHAILNNRHILTDDTAAPMQQLYDTTVKLDNKGRAYAFADNQPIDKLHHEYSTQGETAVQTDVDVHYNAFVRYGQPARLYELDGTKHGPIDHGELGSDDDSVFLQRAIEVIKTQFIDNDPGDVRFSIQALIKTPE